MHVEAESVVASAPTQRTVRWGVVVAYALVAAATQMLWLTYAAITTDTAHAYGVSESTVGWLSEIFPLLYVVLAIPAGILLDRWFRPVLAIGAALVATGGLIRLGDVTFAWALVGQVVVAIAQPIVLSAVGKLAAEYAPAAQRPTAIAIGSAGSFVGMLAAVLLGPTLGAHGHLDRLLTIEAALATAAAIGLAAMLRRPAPATDEPAGTDVGAQMLGGLGPAKALWALPQMRTLCGLVFIGFGVFVALSTWLQVLLHPDGVSDDTAGGLLVAMILAGVVGCAVLPAAVARRGSERRYMGVAVATSALGCAALGALPWIGARGAVLVAIGVVLLPALPIVLAAAEQLAGSAAAGSAGAIVWMAGNLGGLVVALIVQVLVHHPLPAFLAMAVVSLLGAPLARRVMPSGTTAPPATPA